MAGSLRPRPASVRRPGRGSAYKGPLRRRQASRRQRVVPGRRVGLPRAAPRAYPALGTASITTKACRIGVLVGEAQMDQRNVPGRDDGPEPLGGASRQVHGRLARGPVDDAHVAPEHAVADAGTERLGAGFLGGRSVSHRCRHDPPGARPCGARVSVKHRATKRSPCRSRTSASRRMSQRSLPIPTIMARGSSVDALDAREALVGAHLAQDRVELLQIPDPARRPGSRAGRATASRRAGPRCCHPAR